MKKLVVLSGAGISAESGISTFRDADGLWEGHDVMTVASPEGWTANPALVLDFYNQRRRQLLSVQPNSAHQAIATLQHHYKTDIITQNVDDLHERAGSRNVLHLHGQLKSVRSENNPNLCYPWEKDVLLGDTAEDGKQLRPDIVWFGEGVPLMSTAVDCISQADRVIIIGTSLQVYPAAGLMHYAPAQAPIDYIDPQAANTTLPATVNCIADTAVNAMQKLLPQLIQMA